MLMKTDEIKEGNIQILKVIRENLASKVAEYMTCAKECSNMDEAYSDWMIGCCTRSMHFQNFGYSLCLMVKKDVLEPHKVYVKKTNDNKLQYAVISPEGIIIKDHIDLTNEKHLKQAVIGKENDCMIKSLKPFLDDILAIISNQYSEPYYDNGDKLFWNDYMPDNFWELNNTLEEKYNGSTATSVKNAYKKLFNSYLFKWMQNEANFKNAKAKLANKNIDIPSVNSICDFKEYRKSAALETIFAKTLNYLCLDETITALKKPAIPNSKIKEIQQCAKSLQNLLPQKNAHIFIFNLPEKQHHFMELLEELIAINPDNRPIIYAKRDHPLVFRQYVMQHLIVSLMGLATYKKNSISNNDIGDIAASLFASIGALIKTHYPAIKNPLEKNNIEKIMDFIFQGMDNSKAIEMAKDVRGKYKHNQDERNNLYWKEQKKLDGLQARLITSWR